ncbi:MAG: AAA family ATPase [Candidatus Thiodiazotropha sp. (ex Troendleina suluensis)]|nr:AAA family ATPase [Candidatus Thiodiazotropha sp. (ex Troendleina suluensis)]
MNLEHIENLDLDEFMAIQEGQFVQTAITWRDEVLDLVKHGEKHTGDYLPWSKTFEKFRLREKEVTLWAGINGHGKSLFVGQVALWLITHSRVLIASMEMPPAKTIERMLCQAAGTGEPSDEFAEWFMDTTNNLHIYDQLDSVEPDRVIAMIRYAAKELGVKHVIIDNLAKCVRGTDDYSAQKDFVDRACWAAKSQNIHVHIVHHIRKGRSEEDIPDKFDVKGAGEITDLVDNAVLIHRNKKKERMIASGEECDEPDARMLVRKQRHGSWEGSLAFWFTPLGDRGGQYISRPGSGCMPWPNPDEQWRVS